MNLYIATTGRTKIATLPSDIRILLNSIGLRSTSRRIALASLLLKATRRRVTAEILYKEACDARCSVSRATVCKGGEKYQGLLKENDLTDEAFARTKEVTGCCSDPDGIVMVLKQDLGSSMHGTEMPNTRQLYNFCL